MQYMEQCVFCLRISRMMFFFSLSSSNRKYDPFAIVQGEVIKQWYTLYVFLYSNDLGPDSI